MKFVCEKENFVFALNIASKGVSSRTTLPVLKGILITCKEGEPYIYIHSSDLEISVKTSAPAFIEESGETVISAKLLNDIIREMPEGQIILEKREDNVVYIKGGNSEFDIQGIEAEEFPVIESGIDGKAFSIDKKLFRDMIRMTAFSASLEDARGIIKGVLCEIKEDEVTLVALDGFRMAIAKERAEVGENINMIISSRMISEVAKIISENEEVEGEKVEIRAGDNRAEIKIGETKVIVRLMEGDFIKYKEILPKENGIRVKVNKNELADSVKRASIIMREGKNAFIKFKAEGDRLIISSRADEGKNQDIINIEKTGDDIEIGFNGKFVMDVLRAISDENIIIEMNTGISPCLIKPEEGDRYEYLILPVRLSQGVN